MAKYEETAPVPPSVYAVGHEYQVCVLVERECTMWVEVGGVRHFDHSNGVLRSGRFLHIAHVPQKALDKARSYKVCLREIKERKPYFTECGDVLEKVFKFRPVARKDTYRIVNMADTHCLVEEPIRSGSYFGDRLDLLVMNGDIPNHSGDVEYFKSIYQISGALTGGGVPCVFSRGNHDMRGIYAEQFADYTPTCDGRSYYTFTAGPIWGVVLDCGEDKADGSVEYGHTICCEAFRREETEFLKRVVADGEWKRHAVRIVASHKPFAHEQGAPFDIERKTYASWCRLLKKISPTVMLSGHLHCCYTEEPGGEHDTYGAPCTVVCSSEVNRKDPKMHVAGAVTISRNGVSVKYPGSDGKLH